MFAVGWFALWLSAAQADDVAAALDRGRAQLAEGDLAGAASTWAAAAADPSATPKQAATAHNNRCVALIRLTRVDEAVAACDAALALRRADGDALGTAKTLSNLGWAERVRGRSDAARAHYAEALALARAGGFAESEAVTLGNLGALAVHGGRLGEALALHDQAAAVAAAHPDAPWSARQAVVAVINQGTVLEKLGQHREALARYDALAPDRVPEDLRASLALNRGTLHRNLEVPAEAERLFLEAAALHAAHGDVPGQVLAGINLGLLRLDNFRRPADAIPALFEAHTLALQAGDAHGASLAAWHLGRALTAVGRLDEAEALHLAGLTGADADEPEHIWTHAHGLGLVAEARGDLAAAWTHYRRALDAVESVRDRLDDAGQSDAFLFGMRPLFDGALRVLAGRADGATTALEVVQRAKERELLDVLGTTHAPRSAADLVAAVGDDLLLELYVGADRVWLFEVGRGAVRMHDLGPRAAIVRPARALRRALTVGATPDPALLTELTALLLGPVDDLARAKVWIAADGELRHTPFEVLGAPALVDTSTVAYLTSGSALDRAPPAATDRPRYLGVAPTTTAMTWGPLHLDPLPFAGAEVRRAAEQLGGEARLLDGAAATPAAVLDALARGADVVHLAAHTILDDRPGGRAAILLAPDPAHPDGTLGAAELARLDLNVGLAVLASCRSGLGPGESGHALHSVAGGFLAAGAGSVVATLWDVDDAATAAMMEQLYHGLAAGLAPAEALRAAKLRLRATPGWDDPSRWAAFVVYGDLGPLPPTRRPWTAWLAPAALLAVGLGLAARARRG
jgi:tetratricopeptide (TPR) repeat protein